MTVYSIRMKIGPKTKVYSIRIKIRPKAKVCSSSIKIQGGFEKPVLISFQLERLKKSGNFKEETEEFSRKILLTTQNLFWPKSKRQIVRFPSLKATMNHKCCKRFT